MVELVDTRDLKSLGVKSVPVRVRPPAYSRKDDLQFAVYLEKDIFSLIFLDSSMVEHSAVNRGVVGSSPTRGAFLWPHGQAVKTSPFHGGNSSSNLLGVIFYDYF